MCFVFVQSRLNACLLQLRIGNVCQELLGIFIIPKMLLDHETIIIYNTYICNVAA